MIRSFETIGHIAHVNLRDDQLPYKHVIAQVLLDVRHVAERCSLCVSNVPASRNTQTFAPLSTRSGRFPTSIACSIWRSSVATPILTPRFPSTDLGSSSISARYARLSVAVTDKGTQWALQVYWNSRLQTEHRRLVDAFEEGCVIADMFCGVGPFAVPAARRRSCTVHANDLNPRSVHYLKKNIALNGIGECCALVTLEPGRDVCLSDGSIIPYNLDARQFIEESRERQRTGEISMFDHIIMNLPAMALEFLGKQPKQHDGIC